MPNLFTPATFSKSLIAVIVCPSLLLAAEAETAIIESGHTQIEMKFGQTRNGRDALITSCTQTTPILARIGLTNDTELRIETDGRIRSVEIDRATGRREVNTGFANTSIGGRWRIVEADIAVARPAIAPLLSFDFPSGTARFKGTGISTNIKLAVEWSLGNDASIGVMPGLLRQKNSADSWYPAATFAVTLGKNLTPSWRGVVELVSPRLSAKKNGGNEVTFNVGSTYGVNEKIELELVYLRGVTNVTAERALLIGVNVKL
jgi:hypothetical protein